MRIAVWYSEYGLPDSRFVLPYRSQSPSLFKKIEFNTKKDIYNEIERLLNEKGTIKYGVGQSLFLQMPFFCNPSEFIPEWCWDMINDFRMCKDFNIPLAKDLDSLNVWVMDSFNIIKQEINNITIYQKKTNGN